MVANHRGSGESSVVVTTLLFLTTSTSATCRRRFADDPAGSGVSDFQCPMCTSAEPYCFTEPTGDLLATVETLERCSARAAHAYGGADNVATELATPNMMT